MPIFVKGRLIEAIAPFSTTGLTVSIILYDEARNASTGTATQIGSTSNYYYSFTPDAEGDWRLVMYNGSEKHVFHFPVYGAADTVSSHDITTTNDTVETTVGSEIDRDGVYALTFVLDLDTLESAGEGGIVTIKLYNKVDGSTYTTKPLARVDYVVGSSLEYPSFEAMKLNGDSKVTIQCSGNVASTRAIPYYYIIENFSTT